MKIKVNGEKKNIELGNEKAFLSIVLKTLGYRPNSIVVELNNLIINSEKWDNEIIQSGDRLEIVSIVGGG